MPIELQSDEGCDFDEDFLKALPDVEKVMVANNLDPSSFTITKARNSSYMPPWQGMGHYFDYTVNTGQDTFTVTYADDAGFLEYFLDACKSKDHPPK